MRTLYVDTTYLYRAYSAEPGHKQVKALISGADRLATAWHGRAESASVLLRRRREGANTSEQFAGLAAQFQNDCRQRHVEFLALADPVMSRLASVPASAPAATNIRAADALPLACAAEHGFTEVHSNDRLFLSAAPPFRTEGGERDPGRIAFGRPAMSISCQNFAQTAGHGTHTSFFA